MSDPSSYLDNLPVPERVLIVLAHPDDAEFFAGGTLAKWASEGAALSLCLVTSGDKGSSNLEVLNHHDVAAQRESETRVAAKKLGIQEVVFLRRRDGEVTPSIDLRRDIVRMIRLKRPDAVMSSDPHYRWRANNRLNHPDHWGVAEAVQAAVYPAARDHLNFPELYRDEALQPHKVRWHYMSLALDPNFRVDTTPYYQAKLDALKEHASQVGDPEAFENRMRERVDHELSTADSPRYAEYFRVIELG